jgi:hypothetical protein
MPAKVKTPVPGPRFDPKPLPDVGPAPLWTRETRLVQIKALGERIDGYIKFMCKVAELSGISGEAKDRAVTMFHERLAAMEKELGRIHENVQLE